MNLAPQETELIGSWRLEGKQMVADLTCRRIEQLIKGQLQKIGTDTSGWEALYRDPTDDRFWELTFPQGEMHGGGPTRLAVSAREHNSQDPITSVVSGPD